MAKEFYHVITGTPITLWVQRFDLAVRTASKAGSPYEMVIRHRPAIIDNGPGGGKVTSKKREQEDFGFLPDRIVHRPILKRHGREWCSQGGGPNGAWESAE